MRGKEWDSTQEYQTPAHGPCEMGSRLTEERLHDLPSMISVPSYDRSRIGPGIVHLGVGAFHRAHQALYTELALERFGGNWGIVGASLRSGDVQQRLLPQDCLYTVVEREGSLNRYRIVGAIRSVLLAPDEPQALVEQLAHPDTRIVTLTITEKGYCYDAGRGRLRCDHPDIRRDLESFPHQPVTAIGYLAASLAQRRNLRTRGVTLLSCDNMPDNGQVLKTVVTDFVALADPSLIPWIHEHVTFPSSMVDRIVPAATDEDLSALEQVLGYRDEAAVFTEPFSQWVVENRFACGAPNWQEVGVLFTEDVTPFETMKLRLLNGSHSLMAYLGYLAGHDFVHEVMADEHLGQIVQQYMAHQAEPTLTLPTGYDIEDYKRSLCRRFANAALNHRTYQIAQDGSLKIPQRWLSSVRDLTRMQLPTRLLALAVAGWIRYLGGERDDGKTYIVDDPLHADLVHAAGQSGWVPGVLSHAPVCGDLISTCPQFMDEVQYYYGRLCAEGVNKTVERFIVEQELYDTSL